MSSITDSPRPPRDLSTPDGAASQAERLRRREVRESGVDHSVQSPDPEVRARDEAREHAVESGGHPGDVNGDEKAEAEAVGKVGKVNGNGNGHEHGSEGEDGGEGEEGEEAEKDVIPKSVMSATAAGTAVATGMPETPQNLRVTDDEKSEKGEKGEKSEKSEKGSKRDKDKSKARVRSPLLEALKLPPIGDFNLPKPVQIKFAPLHIPPHRRWQTAAVALWALLLPISLIIFLLAASLPPLWAIIVPYLIWVQFDTAPEKGGRPKEYARRFFIWKYFAEYYPCSIVKESDLPPDRPYLFGYHPHGIIGMGAFATFATEGTGFSDYFPGVKPHLLTLDTNFKIPIYRDILMMHGIASVSKKSCANILAKGPGIAIAIVIGGAAESLAAHPGTNDLTLRKRFGFIKMAITAGADLVPVFSFGENDIYDQLANNPGSTVFKLQKRFQKMFGFTLPLFHGRGIFNYNYGLMPFRHPIVTVVGSPIRVEKDPNPSQETIQRIQKLYIDELMRIWDKYKDIYAKHRTRELTLVE